MSESILNALIHLFALVANVNDKRVSERGRAIVFSYLSQHLDESLASDYIKLFDDYFDFYSREFRDLDTEGSGSSLLKFQVTNICGQIKRELHQNDRIIVFLRLLEFVNEDDVFSDPEREFIQTVAESFNIDPDEVKDAKAFILGGRHRRINPKNLLIIKKPRESSVDELEGAWVERHKPKTQNQKKIIERESLDGKIVILRIPSTGTFVFRYTGNDDLTLEGKPLVRNKFYILSQGGIIRGKNIDPVYYSDVSSEFFKIPGGIKIVLTAVGIEYRYPLSQNGIRPFSFSEESGQLIGIMGVSGSGKSTLLNVLNGKLKPRRGKIFINTYDIHKDAEKIEGQIGYVPQDDLLIEELSVYQNLYYNAKLCFGNLREERIVEIIEKVLVDLGLDDIRHLKVGNPLNKFISGGQRKRLNIGLELMREPSVLFIDEPTSGLSSLDSDMVMSLLKEQAVKGKLVIANIHQPSSDNFKLLDKLWIIDKGGYPIYTGNPLEALVYFRTLSGYVNPGQTECRCCGNVASEDVLKIIEAKEVSQSGRHTQKRRVQPEVWYKHYNEKIAPGNKEKPAKDVLPPNMFSLPGIEKQFLIFSIRNFLSKISNRQYLLVSLIEAPLLALILGYFTKYLHEGQYIFAENVNLPSFLFMAVVVSLFLGLSVSAEEIIKDRKILERESFLNLSWFSYLNSKLGWVFFLSAVQMITFVLLGALVLEIKGMVLSYWLILFSAACFANMLGLTISSAFNSVVTIYILVPFVLVPQLLLGGVVVKFDDLHDSLTDKIHVPLVGDLMASRWAFEALAVEQFGNNRFQKHFFQYEQKNSEASFKASFLIPRLIGKAELAERNINLVIDREETEQNLNILYNEIDYLQRHSGLMPFEYLERINIEEYDDMVASETIDYLIYLRLHYSSVAREAAAERDRIYSELEEQMGSMTLHNFRQDYHNKALADIALNRHEVNVIYETDDRLVQKKDPGYLIPDSNIGRAHFYAPVKQFNNVYVDTLWFNISALWLMSLILYVAVLLHVPRKIVSFFEKISFIKNK
ncbi:MAG: ATP-binding cassette domain-containing protein [Bacteroidales bacterium]